MTRFEIESRQISEAHEETFAVYRSWLRDTEKMTVDVFDGPTRQSVKAQAQERASKVREEDGWAYVCRHADIGY